MLGDLTVGPAAVVFQVHQIEIFHGQRIEGIAKGVEGRLAKDILKLAVVDALGQVGPRVGGKVLVVSVSSTEVIGDSA